MCGEELIGDLGEQLVGYQCGVFGIGDGNGGDALSAGVRVQRVVLLLNVLTRARRGTLSDSLGEEGEELAPVVSGEA